MKYIIIIMSLLLSSNIYSQSFDDNEPLNNNDFIENKNSISINMFGTSGIVGISYERLLFNSLRLEVGVGMFGFGAGISYYPLKIKKNKISPYIGVKHNVIVLYSYKSTYIPIGLTYFYGDKFNFGADIGFAKYYETSNSSDSPLFSLQGDKYPLLWNIKIGYSF